MGSPQMRRGSLATHHPSKVQRTSMTALQRREGSWHTAKTAPRSPSSGFAVLPYTACSVVVSLPGVLSRTSSHPSAQSHDALVSALKNRQEHTHRLQRSILKHAAGGLEATALIKLPLSGHLTLRACGFLLLNHGQGENPWPLAYSLPERERPLNAKDHDAQTQIPSHLLTRWSELYGEGQAQTGARSDQQWMEVSRGDIRGFIGDRCLKIGDPRRTLPKHIEKAEGIQRISSGAICRKWCCCFISWSHAEMTLELWDVRC